MAILPTAIVQLLANNIFGSPFKSSPLLCVVYGAQAQYRARLPAPLMALGTATEELQAAVPISSASVRCHSQTRWLCFPFFLARSPSQHPSGPPSQHPSRLTGGRSTLRTYSRQAHSPEPQAPARPHGGAGDRGRRAGLHGPLARGRRHRPGPHARHLPHRLHPLRRP